MAENKKMVEGEFEVGRGYTGSGYLAYGGVLFIWNEKEKRFERASFPVEWTWISGTKMVGKAKVRVPVGTVIKHILFRKGGSITTYYLATEEGFQPLDFKTVRESMCRTDDHEVVAKCNVLGRLGIKDCYVYYVKGPLSHHFKPMFEPEKAEILCQRLEDMQPTLDRVKGWVREKVKKLTGYEPAAITGIGERSIFLKLPYLGREEFKKVVLKFHSYDPFLSEFRLVVDDPKILEEMKKLDKEVLRLRDILYK